MTSLPEELRNRQGERLDFALHRPEGEAREGRLVLLGHGVTGNKDRPILLGVGAALVAAGFPVLRFSFAGNGESEGEFGAATISKELEDLLDVVEQVGFGRRLAYAGHSQGAAVGVLAAARDERIEALVSLAGMVRTAEFYEREFGDQVPGAGVMWEDGNCPLSREYAEDMAWIGSTEAAAAEVHCPYLLVHGSADDTVPPADSELAAAAAGRRQTVQRVVIEAADHSFTGREREVGEIVRAWLEAHWT